MLSDGYSGYTTAGSIQTSKLIADQPERTANALEDVYMYERPVPDGSNQTAVIAKIQWKPKWVGTGDPEDPDQYMYRPIPSSIIIASLGTLVNDYGYTEN